MRTVEYFVEISPLDVKGLLRFERRIMRERRLSSGVIVIRAHSYAPPPPIVPEGGIPGFGPPASESNPDVSPTLESELRRLLVKARLFADDIGRFQRAPWLVRMADRNDMISAVIATAPTNDIQLVVRDLFLRAIAILRIKLR
jgi:hypothetical protein